MVLADNSFPTIQEFGWDLASTRIYWLPWLHGVSLLPSFIWSSRIGWSNKNTGNPDIGWYWWENPCASSWQNPCGTPLFPCHFNLGRLPEEPKELNFRARNRQSVLVFEIRFCSSINRRQPPVDQWAMSKHPNNPTKIIHMRLVASVVLERFFYTPVIGLYFDHVNVAGIQSCASGWIVAFT